MSGNKVVALQFHSEITIESLQVIIAGAGHEVSLQVDFTQSAEFIKERKDLIALNNNLIENLLD
jgi:hypothetical protein